MFVCWASEGVGEGDLGRVGKRVRRHLRAAVGADNSRLLHKEATTDETGVAFAAIEAFGMPVLILKCDEFAASET